MDTGTLITIGESIFKIVASCNASQIKKDNLLRAFYFEIRTNRRLLELANREGGKNLLIEIAKNLEFEATAAILYGNDTKCMESLVKEIGDYEYFEDDKETPAKIKSGNLFGLVDSYFVSVCVIKKLAFCGDEVQNVINLKTRLNNLEKNMKLISEKIEEISAITKLW